MQYNCHIEKYKTGDVGGIRAEQFRLYQDQSKYKNRIQHEMTRDNVYTEYRPWFEAIRKAKERQQELTGKAVRKDAVVLCSAVQSVPESWPREAAMDYFQQNEQFMKRFLCQHGLDPDGMLSAVTHYDEQPPHQTVCWMPVREGRFQAKQLLTKQTLQALQKEGYQFYRDWAKRHPDLEQIQPYRADSGRQHLSELDYKTQKLQEAAESAQERVSALDKEMFDLDVQIAGKRATMAEMDAEITKRAQQLPLEPEMNAFIDHLQRLPEPEIHAEPEVKGLSRKETGRVIVPEEDLKQLLQIKRAADAAADWYPEAQQALKDARAQADKAARQHEQAAESLDRERERLCRITGAPSVASYEELKEDLKESREEVQTLRDTLDSVLEELNRVLDRCAAFGRRFCRWLGFGKESLDTIEHGYEPSPAQIADSIQQGLERSIQKERSHEHGRSR